MFAASHFPGMKTPIQFMPLSMSKSELAPIQFMPLSMPLAMPKSYRAPIQFMPLSMLESDRSPIQFMPLSMPKSYHSSGNGPIFNSRMSVHSSSCEAVKYDVIQIQSSDPTPYENEFNYEVKLDSSSVKSAAGIMEIANCIHTLEGNIRTLGRTSHNFEIFEKKGIVIRVSAIGETTEMLQLAGNKAVSFGISKIANVPDLEELTFIKDLHLRTVDELGIDRDLVSKHLVELEKFLQYIASMKQMTPSVKHYLLSFGGRMASIIIAAYLNKIGEQFKQYDPLDIGSITFNDLTKVYIVKATYPTEWINDPVIPINTSSLEKSMKPSKEGDKPMQISYNPKAPKTDDKDTGIVRFCNATMLDITRMPFQFKV